MMGWTPQDGSHKTNVTSDEGSLYRRTRSTAFVLLFANDAFEVTA
jgi:hypothetical protein